MKKRFSEVQIMRILKSGESGQRVLDICREHGICEQTYYNQWSKYGGMELSDMKKLKSPDEENRTLKRLVAEQALDILVLKDVIEKKI